MIALHEQLFEWTHDEPLVQNILMEFAEADHDLDPICLKNKELAFIKKDIEAAIANR